METSFMSKSYVQTLITLVLVGVLVALGAYAHLTLKQARGTYTGATTISVSGMGEVLAKPDIGQFSFSVRAEGTTAKEAQDKSATAINDIMAYLKEAGVEEKDIKTDNYNLNPRYRYEERACPFNSYCPTGEQIVDGYEVWQNVSVKVRKLEAAGDLISGVGSKGATDISNLNFTIDDETALKAEAREKAIADAKEKAKQLAANLDMRIVRIVGFYENEGGYSPMYGVKAYDGDMVNEMAAVPPDVPVGENSINSNVSLTFELQ